MKFYRKKIIYTVRTNVTIIVTIMVIAMCISNLQLVFYKSFYYFIMQYFLKIICHIISKNNPNHKTK